MTGKMNCWEIMKCGRESGGNRVEELGECPAASSEEFTGTYSGQFGGRTCWRIKEQTGKGTIPHWADPSRNCLECGFFGMVRDEEGELFIP